MEHFITCNQKAFVSLSDKMDIKDAAIFNWIIRFFHTDNVEQRIHSGNLYFRLDYNYMISQLPLLNINNTNGIYRRLKKLQSFGLLEPHPDNGRIVEEINGRQVSKIYWGVGPNYTDFISSISK